MKGGKDAVSEANLEHVRQVIIEFRCHNFEENHNLYLKCDTFLLAGVFKKFRQISHKSFGLDCALQFSASNLAGDDFKRTCKDSNGPIISDRRHLELVQTEECFNFNPDQPSTYELMIDTNNLNRGVVQTEKLPVRNFELVEHLEDEIVLNQILKTTEDSLIGFSFQVDIEYSTRLTCSSYQKKQYLMIG